MKIVYRIVNGVLAAAVFPAFFFLQLIYAELGVSFFDEAGMSLELTVKRLLDIKNGNDPLSSLISPENFKSITWPASLNVIKGRIVLFCIFLALALLAALFIIVICFFCKKRTVYLAASSLGLVSVIAFKIIFSTIASKFVDGTISVVSLVSSSWWVNLLGGAVTVDNLYLGGFANGMLILFIALVLTSVIDIVTDDNQASVKK